MSIQVVTQNPVTLRQARMVLVPDMPIQAQAMDQDDDWRIGWATKFVDASIATGFGHIKGSLSITWQPNLTQCAKNRE
jgi:hypothetical protein